MVFMVRAEANRAYLDGLLVLKSWGFDSPTVRDDRRQAVTE